MLLEALVAAAAGRRLALVGGAVRDLLLHRRHNDPWRGLPDLDLVVEGTAAEFATQALPAPALARTLLKQLGADQVVRIWEHGSFGTVKVEWQLQGAATWLLDIASAREESYPKPAGNPIVRLGRLENDLARRDFTVNAMALMLDADGRGVQLLDPEGGQRDLATRQLRFLHPGSLRDDPTRLVRGARYAVRLGFSLEASGLRQAYETIDSWPWPWRCGDAPEATPPALGTRLRMELELVLEREPWRQVLATLQRWGGLALLDSQLQADRHWRRRLGWAERLGLPLMVALVAGASDPLALAERLQLPRRQHRLLVQWLSLRDRLVAPLPAPADAPAWCTLLETGGLGPEAVALTLAVGGAPRRPLLRWLLRWRGVKPSRTAEQLIAEGWQPGPALGAELRRLRWLSLALER
jgi:poly(A) polymerase